MGHSWVRGIQEEHTPGKQKIPRDACECLNFIALPFCGTKCVSYAWLLGILLTGGKSEEGSTYCTDIYGAWWDLWWDFVCVCLEYGLVSRIPVTTATKHLWHSRKSWHLFASDLLMWQRKARERMAGDIYVQSFTSSTWLTVLCRICLQWELRASQSPNISWDKQPLRPLGDNPPRICFSLYWPQLYMWLDLVNRQVERQFL